MFYTLYLEYETSFRNLKNLIIDSNIRGSEVISQSEKDIVIVADAFTLRVEAGGHNAAFAAEDYSLEFNICFWLDINSSETSWAKDLMNFVNQLMRTTRGDLVLESNGDKPIVLRREEKVYVDCNFGNRSFPFDLLSMKYEESSSLVRPNGA